jgi:hypothetical protein
MTASCQIVVDEVQQFHTLEMTKVGEDYFVANPIPPHQPAEVKLDPKRLVSIDDDAGTYSYVGVLLTLQTPSI